ncbi:MAG: bifunctional folylpolyglutamate synthase/dihydrofolate synthase [Rhabdochlamydiaceae bacterium]
MSDKKVVFERLRHLSASKGSVFGLENMHKILDIFHNPERDFKVIHVAGTNGKGSVTTKIAKILELSGYRTGLYTSPHLFSFRERITVNSVLISEEESVKALQEIFLVIDEYKISATFFEILTTLAFLFFRKAKVDVAVIETGLGGRLDATNVVCPILSIITSISWDHMAILGHSLEAIAKEKAGIIKPFVPVVLGPKAVFESILQEAFQKDSPLYITEKHEEHYEQENIRVVLKSMEVLGPSLKINPAMILEGVQMKPLARFQEVQGVIFDVAHNLAGFEALLYRLKNTYPSFDFKFIVGFSKEKDFESCLHLLAKNGFFLYVTQAVHDRAASVESLASFLRKIKYEAFEAFQTVTEAVNKGCGHSRNEKEKIVICGSFFLMQEAFDALGVDHPVSDMMDLNERSLSSSSTLRTF